MTQEVSIDIDDSVAIVRIYNPPVNATSTSVRAGLIGAVAEVNRLGVRVAVLICDGKTFIAGGDMGEFDTPAAEPHLPDVVRAIEDSIVPFLAAMHGNVLGGGLEIAMGCAWRLAQKNTKFGLPEVNIGLVPGAGGTQRLPRLVGLKLALTMCSGGKAITAQAFADAGGLDKVVAGNLEQEAILLAKVIGDRPAKISKRTVTPLPEAEVEQLRKVVAKSARGQKSPLINFEAVLWSQDHFDTSQSKERALHLELRQSPESIALRHAFFAERAVSKPKAIQGANPTTITKIAVVGGGLMGTGIATAAINAGVSVTLIEQNNDACVSAHDKVAQNLDAALKRGLIDKYQRAERLERFNTTSSYKQAAKHDLAIEAVFEDGAVKADVFRSLADHMDQDAILATNTSYLDPRSFFEGISNPSRCVGLHFFSPAHIMKLLEVVQLPGTSADTLATAFAFAKKLRKTAVVSGICDGFIGNRILTAYRREAEYLLADGALPENVDAAIREFGFAMGPFETQDMSGLQIAWSNRKQQSTTRDPKQRYVTIADQLCELERFGQRSDKGWYDYPSGPKTKLPAPEVQKVIENYSATNGIVRKKFNADEIASRLLAVMANEGALIVEDGIAENDAAVDVVKLLGYGFPRWRGGPMHTASVIGDINIRSQLEALDEESPGSWIRAARYI